MERCEVERELARSLDSLLAPLCRRLKVVLNAFNYQPALMAVWDDGELRGSDE